MWNPPKGRWRTLPLYFVSKQPLKHCLTDEDVSDYKLISRSRVKQQKHRYQLHEPVRYVLSSSVFLISCTVSMIQRAHRWWNTWQTGLRASPRHTAHIRRNMLQAAGRRWRFVPRWPHKPSGPAGRWRHTDPKHLCSGTQHLKTHTACT